MRYNNYQNNAYPKRNPLRYQEREKPSLGKRLIEAFLTQFTICVLVTGGVFGAQLLKLPNINQSVDKVKTIITYSPSLKEFAMEAKEGVSTLIGRANSGYEVIDQTDMPIIIVDDEIF